MSQDFLAETERQHTLFRNLIADLKKKGKINPRPYPPIPHSWEAERLYEVKQHFALLRKRFPRDKYLEQVSIYERALNELLAYPPCRRDLKGFPLIPQQIAELTQIDNLPTPRNGGRSPSQKIQARNQRIVELKKSGTPHQSICKTLDKETFAVPPTWREKLGIQTWRQAYAMHRNSVHSLISKA